MKRTVANIFEDTRNLLNKVKEEFVFSSDDQAIKYLCNSFLASEQSQELRRYLDSKVKREHEKDERE
ncbi:hypothetical protein [Paenibacillus tepidiphilus]|uniref:hypothetical protein n=1 Tax=Paenibacillus tepidiphilus TaxID=2608683 RepID=UPI00123A5A24|nr:hypothetical protein [Paenibacillus tepidiphilus]